MHEHLHTLIRIYSDRQGQAHSVVVAKISRKDGEFEAYLSYWLSTLFVVEQGLAKLQLSTDELFNVFKKHLRALNTLQQETYEF